MSEAQAARVPAAPLHEQDHISQRRWFILGVMCTSLVMVVMAVSSLNVALPTIQRDLDASASTLQWIIDAYALVFAGLLLTGGALGDRFGRKWALLSGLFLFGTGALLSGIATSVGTIIIGRGVQGVGAALVMPATLSTITAVFPPQERQRAISIWVGFAGAGGAIGPVVSGALLNHFWWGAAFLVNLPVVAFVATAIAVVAPNSRDESDTPLDPMGAVFSLIGLGSLLYAIIEGPDKGWTNSIIVGAFIVAAVTLFTFVQWERRTRHPMLPIHFFNDRRFSTGAAVITSAFFVMFGFFFLFSLYLQYARGYSPLGAGIAALPFAGTMIIVSPRSAALVERIGPGRTIASGLALVSIGMVLLSTISVRSPYLLLVVVMMFLAGGMAITVAPSTGGIMATVPMAKAGVGSAVNDTTRELGGALGIAVFGSIANSAYRAKIDVGGLGLPPAVAKMASESVGAASRVASQVGGAQAAELVRRAGDAYTNAYNVVALVAAVFIGLAALAVLRVLPADKVRPEDLAPGEPAVAVES